MSDSDRDAYAVALENIQAQYKALGEKFDAGLQGLEGRMNEGFSRVEGRIAVVESVVREHSGELKGHSAMLRDHSRMLEDHSRILESHSRILERIETKLDTKVDEPQVIAIVERVLSRR